MNRRGFTLLELMIALGITSVVVAGISIILVKQSQASVKQSQQRTLEETGRQALLEIAYAVRMAGAGIDPIAAFDFDHYACGSPPVATNCNNNPGLDGTPATPGSRDRTDGPDELVVSYRNPTFTRNVTSITGTDPYTVTIDNGLKTALNQGRIAMLLCSGADPVSYVALAADAPQGATSLTLRRVTDADGYYPKAPPADNCFGKGVLTLVERVRYFVANDFDGVPALFRDRGRGAPEVLFRGIEDLQLTYTIGPAPTTSAAAAFSPAGCTDPRPIPGADKGWVFGLCNQGTPPESAAPPDWMNDAYDSVSRFSGNPANIRSVQINLVARSSQLSPDRAGDLMPTLANRPAPPPDPAHPYNRSVFTIAEQTPNLLSRARVMPAAGGG
jgi:prepilin-type N-terminal cleavage/methylation domain-containing protein